MGRRIIEMSKLFKRTCCNISVILLLGIYFFPESQLQNVEAKEIQQIESNIINIEPPEEAKHYFDRYDNQKIYYTNKNGIEMTEREYYYLLQFYKEITISNMSKTKFEYEMSHHFVLNGSVEEIKKTIESNLS